MAFFVHLALAAGVRRLALDRRLAAGMGGAVMAVLVVAVSRLEGWPGRDWAPVAYVLAAYYLSARTFVAPMTRVEAWLMAWDRRLLGDPVARFAAWPPVLLGALDSAYIGCFLLVPGGFAALAAAGRADLADCYWTMVAGAELGAFATLPYLQTRPPWVIERLAEADAAAPPRPSGAFMQLATTGANTLPSGHAAGSLAVALAVIAALPELGLFLLALALTIAAAAIVTRAHYVVDVAAGLALALAVWGVVTVARLCG